MNRKELDALTKPTAPERIYQWQHNQMSIARYYGGLRNMGHHYTIAENEEATPLVRHDVFVREGKAKREAEKAGRVADKQAAQDAQGALL